MGISNDTALRDLSYLNSHGKLPLIKEGHYWKVVKRDADGTHKENGASPDSIKQYSYDVALSFAGEDRIYAEALAGALRHHGIRVFYDKYEKDTLWGKDLYTHLSGRTPLTGEKVRRACKTVTHWQCCNYEKTTDRANEPVRAILLQ